MFNCSKCVITLSSHDELKNHCRSKWHAYNLMRATQGRQPTSLTAFEALTKELLHHKQTINEQVTLSCVRCNKSFSSEGTFASHQQSRSHKSRPPHLPPDRTLEQHGRQMAAQQNAMRKQAPWDATDFTDLSDAVKEESLCDDSDGSWEELDDEEDSTEASTTGAWPCLLCPLSCAVSADTLLHMREVHSFTVPHREACDLHRMYTQLAATVQQLHRCPQCGRRFLNVAAVQRHMTDKPHLTINPLSKQYRCCYSAALFASRLELPHTSPDSCVYELTLASGARLTPRNLALFARQRLRLDHTEPRPRVRRLALQEATRQTSGALQTTTGYRSCFHRQQVAECRRRAPQRLSVATRANALRLRIRAQVERAG